MSTGKTYDYKGKKEIDVKTTIGGKKRLTVGLTIGSNGWKFPPYIILKSNT